MARRLAILVASMCALVGAAPAADAANPPAVNDCTSHGRLTQHYSVSQLRTALGEMPADVQEYTNCYDVIQRALLAQIPGSHTGAATSGSSSGGSGLATPVIVAIVVVALGGATAAAVAIRRRGGPPSA